MNGYIVAFLIYILFLATSLWFRKRMILLRSSWLFLVFIIIYFAGTYISFELLNKAHQNLRDHGIYIDFGHASLLLIMVFGICLITAIFTTISIIVNRNKEGVKP